MNNLRFLTPADSWMIGDVGEFETILCIHFNTCS